MALGRLWGSACTLALLWTVSGPLGSAGFGQLTFYLALFMVLDALVDLGTGQATVQTTANSPEAVPGVLARARRTRLTLGIMAALATALLAFAMDEPGAGWIALAALYPITHALELSTVVLRNQIRWERLVLVRAVASAISLGLVVLLIQLGEVRPTIILAAVATGSALGNLGLHLISRPFLPKLADWTPVPAGPFLRLALPMGLAALCQQLYFWQDNFFLRSYWDDATLGPYNLAVRCMSYGILLAVYASSAAMPWLTREQHAGHLGDALARIAIPLLALAAFCVGLAWPHTESILGLFGEDFRVAGPSLRWLLLAALTVYLGAPWLTGVVALGRGRSVLGIAALALLVNLVGNLAWVPTEAGLGAARATFLTELSVALMACWELRRAGISVLGRSQPLARAGALIGAASIFWIGRWIGMLF